MGNSPDRLVCYQQVESCATICDDRSQRPGSMLHKCLQQTVDREFGMGLSATATDSQSIAASEHGKGSLPNDSAQMGEDVLERRSKGQKHCSTASVVEPGGSSGGSGNGTSSSECKRPVLGGLEDTGWSELISGLSEQDVSLLSSAWRDSTWKTYSSAWKQWLQMCKASHVTPSRPTPQSLATYFGYLHRIKNLAYKTILVRKSVISTFVDPKGEAKLCAHPLVKSMLKAIGIGEAKIANPRKEVWNIESIISWLNKNPPDKNSIFQVSRHTAMLLMLASGRRIHDLTLLSIEPDKMVLKNDSMIFWPNFGSKTDSASHRQSGWELIRVDRPEFDVVSWVKQLISVSASRRKAVPGLSSLFITTRGKVKEASRTIIAGWLKTSFAASNIKASPGSLRSAVASYNFDKNVDLEEILERGNWKGPKNFFKFYYKAVKKPKTRSNNILVNSFKPV